MELLENGVSKSWHSVKTLDGGMPALALVQYISYDGKFSTYHMMVSSVNIIRLLLFYIQQAGVYALLFRVHGINVSCATVIR